MRINYDNRFTSIMKSLFSIIFAASQLYCAVARPSVTSIERYVSSNQPANPAVSHNEIGNIRTRSVESDESSEEEGDEFTEQVVQFFKTAVEQIKSDPKAAKKVKRAIDKLMMEFPENEHPKSLVPLLLKMGKSFLGGKYLAPAKTMAKIATKANRDMKKDPNTLSYNLSKVNYKALRTVGNGMENVGDLLSDTIRVVKDLHKTQAGATNYISTGIPVVGKMVRMYNTAMNGGLETLELTTKYGLGGSGKLLTRSSDKKKDSLKEKKSKKKDKNDEERPINEE